MINCFIVSACAISRFLLFFLLSLSNLNSFRKRHFLITSFSIYVVLVLILQININKRKLLVKIYQNTVTSIHMFSIFLNFNKRRSFPRLSILCVNCNLYRILIVLCRTCFVGCVWLVGGGGSWLQCLDGEGLIWRGSVNVSDGR